MAALPTAEVLRRVDGDFAASVARLQEFLRIPSIGTDPAYDADTGRAAKWLADELSGIGFDAAVRATPGQPMVVGHHPGPGGDVPHLLYYGHYDVQPADPVKLWDSPPFEPTIVDGPRGQRVVARGAVDDKGQLMTFVEAFRAWQAVHGTLPCKVTVFCEGEEESSSASLEPFMQAHRDELAADICVVSDTGMLDVDKPAITYMLRGLTYLEITLWGPSHDLHSGMYGGGVVNPINVLARIIADMHDEDGKIAIPGMYDDVRELGAREKAAWEALGVDEAGFLASAGLTTSLGEAGRSLLERTWSRPALDVNGIWGGYTGEGSKTVIAAKASAKLSCRLVPDQDAEKIKAAIHAFIAARMPPDCRFELEDHGTSGAIRVATDSPFLAAASRGIEDVFHKAPVLIGCGGSIPVVGSFQRILGLETLLVGFGLDDDRVHSPNEKFELVCYRRGIETHAAMLARFAELGG